MSNMKTNQCSIWLLWVITFQLLLPVAITKTNAIEVHADSTEEAIEAGVQAATPEQPTDSNRYADSTEEAIEAGVQAVTSEQPTDSNRYADSTEEAIEAGVQAVTSEQPTDSNTYADSTEEAIEAGVQAATSEQPTDSNTHADTRASAATFANNKSSNRSTDIAKNNLDSKCELRINQYIKSYFRNQLLSRNPHVIQFKIKQQDRSKYNTLPNVFKPFKWFWIYAESAVPYPFLSWSPDYGVLSFHLLEARTIHIRDVYLHMSDTCLMTYGSNETTKAIVETLVPLINVTEDDFPIYPESYFCYYWAQQEKRNTFHYTASQYFLFPIKYIEFKCTAVSWNFADNTFNVGTQESPSKLNGFHAWNETSLLPYVCGVVLWLAFPIALFTIAAWMSMHERVVSQYEAQDEPVDKEWSFATGKSPLTLIGLLSLDMCGLGERFPVSVSRVQRFVCILVAPMCIYMQSAVYLQGMGMWDEGDKITIDDLVKAGVPMGFISLFCDNPLHTNVFVPFLGGPVGVVLLYYIIGTFFIALPRNLKQIVEDGMSNDDQSWNSPLFLGFGNTLRLSMCTMKRDQLAAGYTRASTLMKCRFYCLFSRVFWEMVWEIQTNRINFIWPHSRRYVLCLFFLPVYIMLCLIEILCCIIYYGVPLCSFVAILVKGASNALMYLGNQSIFLYYIFSYRISIVFVFFIFTLFAYIISLMFINSFVFIFQIITHCLVAVILYPSISFGILFFFVFLVHYFIKLVRDFGDGYNELLATSVEMSRRLVETNIDLHIHNGHLNISNVRSESITHVFINGTELDVSSNVLQLLKDNGVKKIKKIDSVYGIPRELLHVIVQQHRPIHYHVLSLCFKAILMIAFVATTLRIISNYVSEQSTEMSEVMHVIFIVAVGALPKLVEAMFAHSNSLLEREIEERSIENTIEEYWNDREYVMNA